MLEVLFSVMTDDELINCFKRIDGELDDLKVNILLSQSTKGKTYQYLRFEDLVNIKDDIESELINRGVES